MIEAFLAKNFIGALSKAASWVYMPEIDKSDDWLSLAFGALDIFSDGNSPFFLGFSELLNKQIVVFF
jgi:hypothetical protein